LTEFTAEYDHEEMGKGRISANFRIPYFAVFSPPGCALAAEQIPKKGGQMGGKTNRRWTERGEAATKSKSKTKPRLPMDQAGTGNSRALRPFAVALPPAGAAAR
jgi:hypothetical protein